MLDSLPPEVIEQILGHVPTASSIANVARTNRKLYAIVSANNYAVFRTFVLRAFPSIRTPPLWRDVACTLTSRSRAWERNAFFARECHPSENDSVPLNRGARHTFGFVPAIDSYEDTCGDKLNNQKQVLAIGAGGRLRLRVKQRDKVKWASLRLPNDHLARNDILDVRLLRPHQHQNYYGESLIIRRANNQVVKVESNLDRNSFAQVSEYQVNGDVDCVDVSSTSKSLLAICSSDSLQLFDTDAGTKLTRPSSVLPFSQDFKFRNRRRCVKFLNETTIATSVQFVQGLERAPILIYDVSPSGVTAQPFEHSSSVEVVDDSLQGRHSANVITALDHTASLAGRPGQVFLSGWTDGITRLHDLRAPSHVVAQYVDSVNDGQILSLAIVGHERFFAGSHQDACLKSFDMRMPGYRRYSYLDAKPPLKRSRFMSLEEGQPVNPKPRRGINIFLALTVQRSHLWAPLPRNQSSRNARYSGPVYSLSVPSPCSPTLFAGIENHVIQLDFVSTDDVLWKRDKPCDPASGLSSVVVKPEVDNVLSLSCYERPREEHVTTDPVLLRKQINWHETLGDRVGACYGVAEDGWDDRWRLSHAFKGPEVGRRWRSGDTS